MTIKILSPMMVNQIAAGEVVERPASVVKELMENAIDAGATRVKVEIEEGGLKRVRVSDDGMGIPQGELHLAVTPHATSKIFTADDLYHISTLGFRGEALASIASVSRFELMSRHTDSNGKVNAVAYALDASEGEIGEVRPCATKSGTVIDVRELFCNVPARRKFLKSSRAESNAVRSVFEDVALVHPHVGLMLVRDKKTVYDLALSQHWDVRVRELMGFGVAEEMLVFDTQAPQGRCYGLVGPPSLNRSNSNGIVVCINGRAIKDRSLQHAVREAYRGLLPEGKFPRATIFLHLPPETVDVNVHPQKHEIRLAEPRSVFSLIRHSVISCLKEADLTPKLEIGSVDHASAPVDVLGVAPSSGSFLKAFKRMDGPQKQFAFQELRNALSQDAPEQAHTPALPMSYGVKEPEVAFAPEVARSQISNPVKSVPYIAFRNAFLVIEDSDGLQIIDQHALHERIMFEKIKTRILADGNLASQRRLVPAIETVTAAQIDALDSSGSFFKTIGFEVTVCGPLQIAIHAVPALMVARRLNPEASVLVLLQQIADGELAPDSVTSSEEAMYHVLDTMACKSSVRAGEPLSDAEVQALLQAREQVENSSACPHGRPTTLRITLGELEKRFGR